ncbi:MAG: hypothetical protein P5702_04640 [Limnospira sp. PMC 1291.21]|uniref:Type II toxin-antitoxin system VapC family toxin n=1 Tax=Limnospira fusiformis PMC 851.14 TaxID=2219512 RepID=A0ABU9EMP5_LIMFS|nr:MULTISPECIES: hypothetical protein [Limnospira]EKD09461.1 hypothetical protein SPLC1_S208660 [Arthrospira platensis C1]MDC0837671.1 hypothetical protein [Limnoraphis robusta]MDY7054397.1 hypothetical protein [Limnospira fusiformis LS22]QJB24807.1 type II toxin-antitoxin system VapC family toxin [Limnospira fusiformis SAG 85.79]MDT9176803.1 hypothetical protein [Limnospira sp. PMC 1238.20]
MIYLLDTNVCILYLNRQDEKPWQEKFFPTKGDRLGKTRLIRQQIEAIALV